MPSNKEILEAQRYNRRRLITAFTSGIPGGRELESKSPFVPLIVGSVVVAIMLGVGIVMSRFAPTLPQDWQDSTLIVVKGTGARYYTIRGVLRPVTNITSARLMSEAGKYKTSEVPASRSASPVSRTTCPRPISSTRTSGSRATSPGNHTPGWPSFQLLEQPGAAPWSSPRTVKCS